MDAFLRRVVEQRELEQEGAIVALPAVALAAKHCRGCDTPLNMSEDHGRDLARHFCHKCGGTKADARHERELARATRRAAYVGSLLALANVPTTQEAPMADEKRSCPSCGKPLRSDNAKGVCADCQRSGKTAAAGVTPIARKTPASGRDIAQTRKKFRIVADALGINGEHLLEQFMAGWLAKIRGSVRAPEEDDAL